MMERKYKSSSLFSFQRHTRYLCFLTVLTVLFCDAFGRGATVYRAVRDKEISSVYRLYRQVHKEYRTEAAFREHLRASEAGGYELYFVAEGGRAVGAVGLRLASTPLGQSYMNVDMIAIDERANLRRVANLLAGFLISHARAMTLMGIEVDGTKYGKQCELFLKSIGFKPSQGKYYMTLSR